MRGVMAAGHLGPTTTMLKVHRGLYKAGDLLGTSHLKVLHMQQGWELKEGSKTTHLPN